MYDFHIHSRVSFDGHDRGIDLAKAAKAAGLSSNSDDYFAPEEAVLVELGTE